MIELDVYQWIRDCYQCDAPTPVMFANDPDSHSLIGMDLIGESLSDLDFARIEQDYSKTQDEVVWGNLCIECDAYQGNFHVRNEMMGEVQTTDPRTTITISPTCEHCEEEEATRLEQARPLCGSCTMKDLFSKYENNTD